MDIDASFRVLARGPVPSAEALASARDLGASAPYLAAVGGGADLELVHASGVDVRLWAPDGLAEMNETYEIERHLPGSLAIGDAFGQFLVERPDGLFAVTPGALFPDELVPVADDVEQLLGGTLGGLTPS